MEDGAYNCYYRKEASRSLVVCQIVTNLVTLRTNVITEILNFLLSLKLQLHLSYPALLSLL
ncbi:hypothetical protein RchiOBHm_Chr2g0172021 [Rosa chinensis]|uniref:Uncharacterized protein n=1 Tax=Rosa chinensis TaxID=74649 RepID=A0A2P6S5G2_ROSCH|nr:hypothetical protein RchiOBHm_Chr2g0172021 [Rosa chinensis]